MRGRIGSEKCASMTQAFEGSIKKIKYGPEPSGKGLSLGIFCSVFESLVRIPGSVLCQNSTYFLPQTTSLAWLIKSALIYRAGWVEDLKRKLIKYMQKLPASVNI